MFLPIMLVSTFLSFSQNDVLNLFLCDTNGKDDIHINDKLVEEGFAVFKRGNNTATKVQLCCTYFKQQQCVAL